MRYKEFSNFTVRFLKFFPPFYMYICVQKVISLVGYDNLH